MTKRPVSSSSGTLVCHNVRPVTRHIALWTLSVLAPILAGMCGIADNAQAISFDKLTAVQSVVSSPFVDPPGGPVGSTVSGATIVGGTRYAVSKSFGAFGVRSDITGGVLNHSQDAQSTGYSYFVWDGNSVPGLQAPFTGLGGLDLTKDGGTAIKLVVNASDQAFALPITISFRLYDASDPSGLAKASRGSVTVNSGITTATEFLIPFSSFTQLGTESGVDFKNIGAMDMFIDGTTAPSYDLAMSFVGTNGNCTHVPVNGFILDKCGVCNGDNSSCSDCKGVPNGPGLPGIFCPTGIPGICGDGTWTGTPPRNCTCSQDKNPSNEICDALDNNCNGLVDEGLGKGDSCTVGVGACAVTGTKVCAQNGSVQCSAVPKQPAAETCDDIDNNCDGQVDEGLGKGDSCTVGIGACQATGKKICGSNGAIMCSAAPASPSAELCDGIDNNCDGQIDEGSPTFGPLVDQCGVCKGDGRSCLDCKGIANGGAKVDQCGVCGGDGKSCLDCAGKINGTAVLDVCGVCGGNGLSCIACQSVDQSATLGTLDSGAKQQQAIVRKAVTALRTLPGSKNQARFISQTLELAQKLQIKNWQLSWTLPVTATTCQGTTPACITTSNDSILTAYKDNNLKLKQLALDVMAVVKKLKRGKLSRAEQAIITGANRQFQANLDLCNTVPRDQDSCST